MNAPEIPTHLNSLPTHRNSLPQPLSSDVYRAAIWIGLIDTNTPKDCLEAKAAMRTVRNWLNAGADLQAGKPIKPNRPYLCGIWTGTRWIIPHAEIAAFLERFATSSKVAS